MSDLPLHWESTILADTSFIQMGQSPDSRTYNEKEDGLPFFQGKAEFGKLYPKVRKWCSEPKKIAERGDVLLSIRAPVGPSNIATEKCAIGRGLASLRAYEPLNQNYLFYFIRKLEPWLVQQGTGSTFAAISGDFVRSIEIPLAPLPEQKRIADKLDTLMARIDACRDRLDRLPSIIKLFKRSVLAVATSGRLTEEWRQSHTPESADLLLARIVKRRKQAYIDLCKSAMKSGNRKPKQRTGLEIILINKDDLPAIPDSWAYCNLQNLGEFTRGRSKHRPRNDAKLYGGPYPFIQTGDIANSSGKITSHRQTYSEAGLAQSRLFPAGTLCVTIAANIADTAILTYPACFPDSVVGLIPDQEFLIEWARYYIQVIQNDLETYAPATAQKNINMEILELVSIPLPPFQEQVEIIRRVDQLFTLADRLEARVKTARARVDTLTPSTLAKAFRGELVPQDPTDEPASVLLERIRAEKEASPTMRRKGRQR